MKNKKYGNNAHSYEVYEDDDENYTRNAKKKRLAHQDKRRPVKNFTKAWSQYEKEHEERDDFYSK